VTHGSTGLRVAAAASMTAAVVENMATTIDSWAALHAVSPMPERLVALTVDDGPSPTYTPRVLAMLDKYGDHATFFVIGKSAACYPDFVKQEVA